MGGQKAGRSFFFLKGWKLSCAWLPSFASTAQLLIGIFREKTAFSPMQNVLCPQPVRKPRRGRKSKQLTDHTHTHTHTHTHNTKSFRDTGTGFVEF